VYLSRMTIQLASRLLIDTLQVLAWKVTLCEMTWRCYFQVSNKVSASHFHHRLTRMDQIQEWFLSIWHVLMLQLISASTFQMPAPQVSMEKLPCHLVSRMRCRELHPLRSTFLIGSSERSSNPHSHGLTSPYISYGH
jgi:hypothetical protein